jgi:hypothetical protein
MASNSIRKEKAKEIEPELDEEELGSDSEN